MDLCFSYNNNTDTYTKVSLKSLVYCFHQNNLALKGSDGVKMSVLAETRFTQDWPQTSAASVHVWCTDVSVYLQSNLCPKMLLVFMFHTETFSNISVMGVCNRNKRPAFGFLSWWQGKTKVAFVFWILLVITPASQPSSPKVFRPLSFSCWLRPLVLLSSAQHGTSFLILGSQRQLPNLRDCLKFPSGPPQMVKEIASDWWHRSTAWHCQSRRPLWIARILLWKCPFFDLETGWIFF